MKPEVLARIAMDKVDPNLSDKYVEVVRFIARYPGVSKKFPALDSPDQVLKDFFDRQAKAYAKARSLSKPKPPETISDEMVSVILREYFDIPQKNLERIKREHSLSMRAENLVGDLLERFLASVLEPQGWVWCAGSVVKAVDFIKPPTTPGGAWTQLQVKNRDNSENSSSKAIRNGTEINIWFRSFSKSSSTNWEKFPGIADTTSLNESKFKAFVIQQLRSLKGGKKH